MKLAIGVTALAALIGSAQAECIRELPKHRTGYWHYRYEHGQKCWFGPNMVKQSERVATDLPALSHRRHKTSDDPISDSKRPIPIPSISKEIEEEIPEPATFAARRVKIFTVTNPPSVSRRIEDAFEDYAKRCEVSLDACRAFNQ